MAEVIYDVTCESCGQRWQQTSAREGDAAACLFCGSEGRLHLGPTPPETGTVARVEVSLGVGRQNWY